MYQPMLPCTGCGRHVRTAETACPFCHAELMRRGASEPASVGRLSRAALVAAGAALAVGCGSNKPAPQPPDGDTPVSPDDPVTPGPNGDGDGAVTPPPGPDDDGAVMAEYGAPAPPPEDPRNNVPAYGAPPVDPE